MASHPLMLHPCVRSIVAVVRLAYTLNRGDLKKVVNYEGLASVMGSINEPDIYWVDVFRALLQEDRSIGLNFLLGK